MFVCLLVCGNPNPCTDLDEILHPHVQGRFWSGVDHHPLTPLGLGGLKPYKLKGTLLKLFTKQNMFSRFQINSGTAGYLS